MRAAHKVDCQKKAHIGRFVKADAPRLDLDVVMPQVGVKMAPFSTTELVLELEEAVTDPHMVIHAMWWILPLLKDC